MNREELAWAAGFFDGEGHTGAKRHTSRARIQKVAARQPSCSPFISIRQADRQVLDRFRDAVGIGKVYGPFAPSGASRRPQWSYRVQGFGDTLAVVALLWYWLGEVKREQALAVFQEHRAAQQARAREWLCGHARISGERQCMACLRSAQRKINARRRAS